MEQIQVHVSLNHFTVFLKLTQLTSTTLQYKMKSSKTR